MRKNENVVHIVENAITERRLRLPRQKRVYRVKKTYQRAKTFSYSENTIIGPKMNPRKAENVFSERKRDNRVNVWLGKVKTRHFEGHSWHTQRRRGEHRRKRI